MKALSLTQPWATLVAIGAKRIETRSWVTPYRGEVAIHAAKKWTADDRYACWDEPIRSALAPTNLVDFGSYDDLPLDAIERFRLPLGAIVAVAALVQIDSTDSLSRARWMSERELAFGDYSDGRYGWLLGCALPLREPIPCRGALGLWTVPPAIERLVRAQVVAR